MSDPVHPIAQLLQEDRRYRFEAYIFVFEALRYAQEVLGMGADTTSESIESIETSEPEESQPAPERHVTGQELCEAIRLYAIEQYGYMAKTVLNSWGIQGTSDFGEIVFNLIRVGQMRKTPTDTRVDFENVFDFDVALRKDFRIVHEEKDRPS